jgi:hypothetical protein
MKRSRLLATIFAVITMIGAVILGAPALQANALAGCSYSACYANTCEYQSGMNCDNPGGGTCATTWCTGPKQ